MTGATAVQGAGRARRTGERAMDSPAFSWLARAGLLARGIVYGVIGVIAIEVASGRGGHPTNQQGALRIVADQPLGWAMLILLAIGLAGYSAWRLTRAAIGRGREESDGLFDRLAGVASGTAYALLCAVAVEILVSAPAGGSTAKETAGILGWPAGPEIVAVAGGVLIGVGLYQGYKAIAKKFMETSRTREMGPRVRAAFAAAGIFGHLARAVVFVLVGYGVLRAAVEYAPGSATGLDGALRELAHASYGTALLGVVAAGLIAFALYSIADSRYRRI